jgi:hypothetical protein
MAATSTASASADISIPFGQTIGLALRGDAVVGFGGIQVTYHGACMENAQVSPLMFHMRPGPSTGPGSGLGAQVAGVSG